MKKLGRIRPGGGWKKLGQSSESRAAKARGAGYDYLHVAIDDHSRYAFVEVHPDERGETCARFVLRPADHFANLGVRVEQVMTDQAKSYVLSRAFAESLLQIGARHITTRPYSSQTNGKALRFKRTMLDEWPYVPLQRSQARHLAALDRHLQSTKTPHRAGWAPAYLTGANNVGGNYS